MKKTCKVLPAATLGFILAAGMAACSGSQSASQTTATGTESAAQTESTAQPAETDTGDAPLDLNTWLMENSEITINDWTKEQQRTLKVDRKRVNDHLIEGYMTYTLPSGRTCKMYIGKHSALRAYITVIALPDGVTDTLQFLKDQGWTDQADKYGELIFVLEPQDGKWGTPEDEAGYLKDCLAETISNDAFGLREKNPGGIVTRGSFQTEDGMKVPVFTGHSCNYYVGYKEGCAPLESWTSENPCYVAGQAFIDGTSAGEDILTASAARQYNGINTGGYYPGLDDNSFHMELIKLRDEGVIQSDAFITNADIPVPTLFAGYADNDPSVNYWKGVNDTEDTAIDGVYHQKADSDAWQTEYNNTIAKELGSSYGISEVRLTEDTGITAGEIRDFLSMYTRYTNVFAYSNTLGLRTDYYPVMHKAREDAESGNALDTVVYASVEGGERQAEIRALESARLSIPFMGNLNQGDIFSCVTAFNDYDGDGTLDPRECLVYVPDSAKKNANPDGIPVVLICPGSTQASCTFFDCSYWWHIADQNGCAFAILGQFCNSSAASLSYGDQNDSADFCRSTLAVIDGKIAGEEGIKIDHSRIYGSGHSAGCRLIQTLTHTTESGYFAAVGSTSFPNSDFSFENGMPSYLSVGQADISEPLPNPFSRDLVKEPWIVTEDSAIYNWVRDCLKDNGIEWSFTADDKDSFLSTCMDHTETGRYHTYTWADKSSGVPIVRFNRTVAREHNCMPVEFSFAWDFISRYRLQDGKRYYSPSAFASAGDTVQIDTDKNDIK